MHGIFINFKKFLGHEIFFTTCLRRQAGQVWCRPYSVKRPPLTRIQVTQTSQLIRHFTVTFINIIHHMTKNITLKVLNKMVSYKLCLESSKMVTLRYCGILNHVKMCYVHQTLITKA